MASLSAVIETLRAGKAQLRQERTNAPLEDKVQALLTAQRLYVEIAGSQRQLPPWQRPWNIKP